MNDDARLSRIETLWSVVKRAHAGDTAGAQAAQQRLLDQYGGAVRRYLLAALRDEDSADDVFQEFALRFVRGDYQQAHPDRGRFRSFVKTSIYHLIVDYQRRVQRERRHKNNLAFERWSQTTPSVEAMDEPFTASWRHELLARAWSALQEDESETGKPHYTVLRFRADHPELRSPELAAELSRRLDRPINAGNVRVLVHRARQRFADLLVAAVEVSLDDPSTDELESELIALNLLSYCRSTLASRRESEKH